MFRNSCLMQALLALLLTGEMVGGCRYGLHARSRRQAGYYYELTPEQLDRELNLAMSAFFEKCLRTAASDIFPSLKTTVDFAIENTQWYKDARDIVCAGEKDSAECWISVLPFFLDTRSPLYAPTARCICDWVDGCMPSAYQKKYKWAAKDGPQPPHHQNACGEIGHRQQEPLTTFEDTFASCTTEKSENSYFRGASLTKLDGKSITIFIENHYTYCKRSMVKEFPHDERVAFALLFMDEACPRTGDGAKWRENVVTALDDCMAEQAPMKPVFSECKEELVKLGDEPLTNRSKANPELPPTEKNVDGCLVKYAGKCFNIIQSDREKVTKKFEKKCEKNGGRLANFYSTEHLRITMEAIRETRPRKNTHFILGMKYDVKRRQLLFSDGNDATFSTKWRPGNPTPHHLHTEVLLYVDADENEPAQGLYNRSTEFARHYALCELDM